MAGRTDLEQLVYSMSTDINKLIKQNAKARGDVNSTAGFIEKRLRSMGSHKVDVGGAFDSVISSTRLKILDSGIARVGLFGGALEKLGPYGIAAAAAIGAVALALGQAGAAAKYADELDDTANRLHVTTDALQEYRFAIREAGGETQGADEALGAFSVTLGKAQAGVPKALKVFKELFGAGFSKDDAKKLGDVGDAIVAVTKKIEGLRSNPQKDAIIDQLGLTGLAPLINEGADAMERLRQRAQQIGIVMDASLIKRGAEASKQFETAAKVVDIQLKSAFVDLAPYLVVLITKATEFLNVILKIADGLRDIEHKTHAGLLARKAELEAQAPGLSRVEMRQGRAGPVRVVVTNPAATTVTGGFGGLARSRSSDQARLDELARVNATLAEQDRLNTVTPPAGTHDLTTPPTGGGGGANKAAEQVKHFNEQLAKIALAILTAHDNELHTTEERAAIARQQLDAEEAAARQQLQDLVATKGITAAQGGILQAENDRLFQVRRGELEAKQAVEQQAATLQILKDITESTNALLNARVALATNAAARARLENEIYERERAIARQELSNQLGPNPNLSPDDKASRLENFDAQTAAEQEARRRQQAQDQADELSSVRDGQIENEIDALHAQEPLAKTIAQRAAIAMRLFELEERLEELKLEEIIASTTAKDAEKLRAQQKLDALKATLPDRRQGVINSSAGPWGQFQQDNDPAKAADKLQELGVNAFTNLADALGEAVANAKDLGDAAKNVFRSLIAQIISMEIKSAAASLFKFLPHFAEGGRSAGGVALVGEKGPELVRLPAGAEVTPNRLLRSIAGVRLSARPGAVTVLQQFHLHAEGAVMTEQLLTQMNGLAAAHARRAVGLYAEGDANRRYHETLNR